MNNSLPEVWLRGPLPDVPPMLQPVAHALLQAGEEVDAIMQDFSEALLWTRPAGVASAGFHLQHLSGVLDRMFTYVRGEPLSAAQIQALMAEGKAVDVSSRDLIAAFHQQVARAVEQLRTIEDHTLPEFRAVGRSQLPSTVLGLLVHAAEHTERHVGQLLVTVRVQARI